MTQDERNAFSQLFFVIYKDNQHASMLSLKLLDFVHAWDDQYDEDKKIDNNILLSALVDIGGSPLWTMDMAAHTKLVYIKWQASNKFEATKTQLEKSWMLRAAVYDIFVMIAEKLYGLAWAESIATTVYEFYGESLSDFLKEINNA